MAQNEASGCPGNQRKVIFQGRKSDELCQVLDRSVEMTMEETV